VFLDIQVKCKVHPVYRRRVKVFMLMIM
jgi:hypothetical protein